MRWCWSTTDLNTGRASAHAGYAVILLSPLEQVASHGDDHRQLLGSHPRSQRSLMQIAERSAGNPFFTEEIVRDLAERGVIDGERGAYIRRSDGDVAVPATVQATIAARIDRLAAIAKRTLSAASVIGSRFGADLLTPSSTSAHVANLLDAEIIEPVSDSPRPSTRSVIRFYERWRTSHS